MYHRSFILRLSRSRPNHMNDFDLLGIRSCDAIKGTHLSNTHRSRDCAIVSLRAANISACLHTHTRAILDTGITICSVCSIKFIRVADYSSNHREQTESRKLLFGNHNTDPILGRRLA